MNSRTHDQSSGDQYPLESCSGHGCINMVHATKVVTRAKDYGSSQPDLGKELAPLESPLHFEKPVEKPKVAPHIPKGFLKRSEHNPNARVAHNYSVVEDLGHTPCVMSALEVLQSSSCKGKLCFLLLVLTMIILPLSSNLKLRNYSLTFLTMCLS